MIDSFTNPNPCGTGWIAVAAANATFSAAVSTYAFHSVNHAFESKFMAFLTTGSLYGAAHALAILGVAALTAIGQLNRTIALTAQWLFLAGIVIYPGALYGLALNGPRWLGELAPFGAITLILGWMTLIIAFMTPSRRV